jgi:coenzyme F420-reducing hydrogenase alpha subunit
LPVLSHHERTTSRRPDITPERSLEEALAESSTRLEACLASEAPRGLLYHRYRIGDDGLIAEARIVPPTSQNQGQIEADLRAYLPGVLGHDDAAVTGRCEHLIRNYDPCISCATHFLRLKIDRGG